MIIPVDIYAVSLKNEDINSVISVLYYSKHNLYWFFINPDLDPKIENCKIKACLASKYIRI